MFDKSSEFNTIGKFDKTGKKINQKDKMMDKYYSIEEDETKSKFYDENGNFQWQHGSDSSSSEEEVEKNP